MVGLSVRWAAASLEPWFLFLPCTEVDERKSASRLAVDASLCACSRPSFTPLARPSSRLPGGRKETALLGAGHFLGGASSESLRRGLVC